MKEKAVEAKSVIIAKSIGAGLFVCAGLAGLLVAPKQIYSSDQAYSLGANMALTDDNHLVFLDYKVYGSEERFEEGLVNDVATRLASFKTRHEILLIKIHGAAALTAKDDYWVKAAPETPELNIEYYIATTLVVENTELPCRSFIMLVDDTFSLINGVYMGVLVLTFLLVETIAGIKLVRDITLWHEGRMREETQLPLVK
jgi:hypothetical protein